MGDQATETTDTVSREAHERIKKERDELKARNDELSRTLTNFYRRDKARAALKDKVADPDTVADLLTPHLEDIEPDKVAEHIASDVFAPKLAPFLPKQQPSPAPVPEGEGGAGEISASTPAIEPNGFGAGPSPGGEGQAPSPSAPGKIVVGSEEYLRLVHANDKAALQKAYEEGRIVSPEAPSPV